MQTNEKVLRFAAILKEGGIARSKVCPISTEAFASLSEEFLQRARRRKEECGVDAQLVLAEATAIYERLKTYDLSSIHALLETVNSRIKDARSPGRVVYPVHIVHMVIMIARCFNLKSANEIAAFYNGYNLILQLLIPGMPSPCNFISGATIKLVRTLSPQRDAEQLYEELYPSIKTITDDLFSFKPQLNVIIGENGNN